jgi:6-methylpretetramide 4-monooxygenase / 4-hydroxy-6-methylpretetramide 12a-monooxygenase
LTTGVPNDQIEVLVVGAGPSGLFAAAELARHGVPARVVEREPKPHHQARATALQPGTLELLERGGVVDPLLAESVHLGFARVVDAELAPVGEVAFSASACRYPFQACLPQWRTERILAERLADLGGAVQRGVAATSLQPVDGAIRVELEHAAGDRETIEARYVIGAGGAHSVTRESMDEVLVGETYPGTALVADVRATAGLPRDGSALIATGEGYVLLAPLPDDRWVTFIGELHDDELELLDHDGALAAVTAGIERRVGDAVGLDEIAWAAPFRMHRRLVSRLAGERRFLLGDAGHLSSPFGGEGLNSGLHDAHNLAWKLALVSEGKARHDLLKTFASERLAADAHVLEVSDGLHEMARAVVEAARTGVRPPAPTADQADALTRSRAMLDVSYAGSPLVGECLSPAGTGKRGLVAGERYPDPIALDRARHRLLVSGPADAPAVAELRARWQGLVDVTQSSSDGPSEAVLVRPDGHVGFRASPADAAGLRALDSHLDSYLIPTKT